MSDPYVYTPRVNYRNSPYLAPFYTQTNSPFIPNLSLSDSGSPFSPSASLPGDPAQSQSPFVPYPSAFEDDDDEEFIPPYPRPRTSSWTGVPDNIPNAGWYRPDPRRPQRRRSRSDAGYFDQPQVVNINNGYWVSPGSTPYSPFTQLPPTAAPPPVALHPYLDGHSPRGDIYFNLVAPTFAPMRRFGHDQYALLTNEELAQPATHPPIYSIQIVSDIIPSWPIDITYNTLNRYSTVAPPLKLGDILSAIYKALHMRISPSVWAQLPPQQINEVTRAFTMRCRSMGHMEMTVRNDGVKRIDFLQGKYFFRGLTRSNDPKVMKFQVSE